MSELVKLKKTNARDTLETVCIFPEKYASALIAAGWVWVGAVEQERHASTMSSKDQP